uniref:Putative ovule protein n=1 Tax=Solanum chacoense TaxID=4108 RepID=A0A0V0HSV5_SOLCH
MLFTELETQFPFNPYLLTLTSLHSASSSVLNLHSHFDKRHLFCNPKFLIPSPPDCLCNCAVCHLVSFREKSQQYPSTLVYCFILPSPLK